MATNNDENVLLLDSNDDDILDGLSDNSSFSKESVFLKFFGKNSDKIEQFLSGIRQLLADKNVLIKGLFFKGIFSVLIEVCLTDSFRNWLITLIEVRNNIRSLSDNARNNILKSSFGKFNFVLNEKIIYLNVIPFIEPHLIKCRSSLYPFGLYNNDAFNILANNIRDDPVILIENFLKERIANDILRKIFGVRVELAGCELSLRFIVKKENISDLLLKFLNAAFGALSFCSSTIHIIPTIFNEKLETTIQSITNTSNFCEKLSEIDILVCTISEQALAMSRNSQAIYKRRCSIFVRPSTSTGNNSNSGSIFQRLGPPVSNKRVKLPKSSRYIL